MKRELSVIDRNSGQLVEEKVWGGSWIRFLYGESWTSKTVGWFLLHSLFRWPILSKLTGAYYSSPLSRRAIRPFCTSFQINLSECVEPLSQFKSFNDFFVRKLRPELRAPCSATAIIPADGRYSLLLLDGRPLQCKGELLQVEQLLGRASASFRGGTAVLGRLCPADCHRFYFPVSGKVISVQWLPGSLFSVNPLATARYPWIFWTNRRMVTLIETSTIGVVACVEVGATNCGSIVQTTSAQQVVSKGQEKGFFKLGGSAIILLFEPGKSQIAPDLVALCGTKHEVLCRIGQPLAYSHAESAPAIK